MMKKIFTLIILLVSVVFCSGQDHNEITTIILIRHAEKMDDGTKDPPLSKEGIKRANLLVDLLGGSEIGTIYSTPFNRTLQTVAPLANFLEIEVKDYNPFEKNFIQSIYRQNIGKTILVSGHSNTTPNAVNLLLGEEKYQSIDHEEYGRIFVVTITKDQNQKVLELHY